MWKNFFINFLTDKLSLKHNERNFIRDLKLIFFILEMKVKCTQKLFITPYLRYQGKPAVIKLFLSD